MPLLLALALAGSLAIHAAALFGTDLEWFGGEPESEPLQAVLRPPPAPGKPAGPPVKAKKPPRSAAPAAPDVHPEPPAEAEAPPALPAAEPEAEEVVADNAEAAPPPVKALLPSSGAIRFAIYQEALGIQVGRAEHSWEFDADGHYRLRNMTETSGLVSLFKPLRVTAESRGRLVAGGLQPDRYQTWKNGQDNRDGADFDWANGQVHLARNDSRQAIQPGAQDLLSLTYQLAYLENPAAGSSISLVTARKVEPYLLEALGEEEIDIPAGHFHTLHLRARADTTTEIWIALDLHRLPVKIRYTDRKGDSFVQVATEIGSLATPAAP
ncbi:MAG: hypothetical protein H6R15_3536 [Proteobacteria bacterium]|nr:hypothetical protein [Pseudomonadota bacterium]